ncbi:transposable element Tcb2 transposase [Trichonephila clavipes]|nr:transposable element Tcb2 transposase [Trichonephila clavipes]
MVFVQIDHVGSERIDSYAHPTQWCRVLFPDESRFSTNSDSRQVFIWRESGTRFVEDVEFLFGGGGIMLDGRAPLHLFEVGSVTAQRYKDEVLEPHMRLFQGAIAQDFTFMNDNARSHRASLFEDFLYGEGICRMEWSGKSSELNSIKHAWDSLGRAIARSQYPPNTQKTLKSDFIEEWRLFPQDNIATQFVVG